MVSFAEAFRNRDNAQESHRSDVRRNRDVAQDGHRSNGRRDTMTEDPQIKIHKDQ